MQGSLAKIALGLGIALNGGAALEQQKSSLGDLNAAPAVSGLDGASLSRDTLQREQLPQSHARELTLGFDHPQFKKQVSQELFGKRLSDGIGAREMLAPATDLERLQATFSVIRGMDDQAKIMLCGFPQQREKGNSGGLTAEQIDAHINREVDKILKDPQLKPEEKVSKCVCLYWACKDINAPGNGDQDGDKIPDRVDRDAYNGHGVKRSKEHQYPAPGSRDDGHYNCEYFAMNHWKAFNETVARDGGKCWIVHYSGHATVSWSYGGKFAFEEPQGGAQFFGAIANLTEDRMPPRGSASQVAGARVFNFPINHWTEGWSDGMSWDAYQKDQKDSNKTDRNWKPTLWQER